MSTKSRPCHVLLEIGAHFHPAQAFGGKGSPQRATMSRDQLRRLVRYVSKHPDLQSYSLDEHDIKLIACAWYVFIVERTTRIGPLELLGKMYREPSARLTQLEKIVTLLKKTIFYSDKKEVRGGWPAKLLETEKKPTVRYHQHSLLDQDICFHRHFIRLLLGETEDITLNRDKPYHTNREFLSDWFAYVQQLLEFTYYDFSDRKPGVELDEDPANDLIRALEWKERIMQRLEKTTEVFPLTDLVEEYKLDENETIILVYLAKEEMEGGTVDTDDVTKLISRDQHEMYRNREYVSVESKLVRNGLVEISENVFFRTAGSDIRVSPDITRRIIMKTPVNDDERLSQILTGDDVFSLLEPKQTFKDLILPVEMKQTIRTAISQYQINTDSVIEQWGLYDGAMEIVGRQSKKLQPGLLMLFYGPPGTGKTFAAGAIANALDKKLLVSDVSRVHSKWVGDSEKNVRRLFSLFERVVRRTENPPVLLLNEADQFLSKRLSNARTAVDIMYNTLQNLFLEAFEQLRGIMIATTNLRENLDTAFSRRFHLKLEFPFPSEEERAALWALHLPDSIPGASGIDIGALAARYQLTGGQIAVVVKNAATQAASRNPKRRCLSQEDLLKYCTLEELSEFENRMRQVGFKV